MPTPAAAATGPDRTTARLPRLVRLALREVLALLLRLVVRIEVTNPGARVAGPAVVVSNHPHWLDGAVAMLADRTLRPVARWQRARSARAAIWVAGAVVTTAGTVRVRRPAYQQAADHLRAGGRIWLAPEGGSHQDAVLRGPRSGAVRMAHAAGVVVQPLGIVARDGVTTGPALRRWRPWRRRQVALTWGAPMSTSGEVDRDNATMMANLAAVTGLAPPPRAPAHPVAAAA